MNDIIVTPSIVFNANELLYITKDNLYLKWPERFCVIEPARYAASSSWSSTKVEKHGVREIKLEEGAYENIIDAIVTYQNQLKYKTRFEELERHVSLMPGGSEYLSAKNDFENNQQIMK
jgi:hypothetical protein